MPAFLLADMGRKTKNEPTLLQIFNGEVKLKKIANRYLSDREPPPPLQHRVAVPFLIDALKKLCGGYLRGGIALTIEGESNEVIDIAEEYTAYTFRLMVQHCPWPTLLRVHIKIDDMFTVDANFGKSLPVPLQVHRILTAGEQAGFKSRIEENHIIFQVPVKKNYVFTLYSSTFNDIYQIFYRTFFVNPYLEGFEEDWKDE